MVSVLNVELRKVRTLDRKSLPTEVQNTLYSLDEKLNPIREELADLYNKQFRLTRKIQSSMNRGDTNAAISIAKSYPDLKERTRILMGRLSDLLKEESYGN